MSHFRLNLIKRLVPTGILVALDSLFQFTGALWQLTPSVFTRNTAVGANASAPEGAFWRCPSCGSFDLDETGEGLTCRNCGTHYAKRNGVYDFKEPLRGS